MNLSFDPSMAYNALYPNPMLRMPPAMTGYDGSGIAGGYPFMGNDTYGADPSMFGMPNYGNMGMGGMSGMPNYGNMGMSGMSGMPNYGNMGMSGMSGMPNYGNMGMGGMSGMPNYGMGGSMQTLPSGKPILIPPNTPSAIINMAMQLDMSGLDVKGIIHENGQWIVDYCQTVLKPLPPRMPAPIPMPAPAPLPPAPSPCLPCPTPARNNTCNKTVNENINNITINNSPAVITNNNNSSATANASVSITGSGGGSNNGGSRTVYS